jgi:hypothetical protein
MDHGNHQYNLDMAHYNHGDYTAADAPQHNHGADSSSLETLRILFNLAILYFQPGEAERGPGRVSV